MWTRNFDNLTNLQKIDFTKLTAVNRPCIVRHDGLKYYINSSDYHNTSAEYYTTLAGSMVTTFHTSLTSFGTMTIDIGTSTNIENYDDYKLGQPLNSAQVAKTIAKVHPVTYNYATGKYKYLVEMDFKNKSTTDSITVTEYGLFTYNNFGIILLYREVLESPITIGPDEYYKLIFEYEIGAISPNDDKYIKDSWESIINNVNNGTADLIYKVGQYKDLEINLNGEVQRILVEIVGKKHDTIADSDEQAALTFMVKEAYLSNKINDTRVANLKWNDCTLRAYLNETLILGLPTVIQENIKPVVKLCDGGYSDRTIHEVTDKIFLPSLEEVRPIPDSATADYYIKGQGTVYEAYANFETDNESLKYNLSNTSAANILTRSTSTYRSEYWISRYSRNSHNYTNYVETSMGMLFAFCL